MQTITIHTKDGQYIDRINQSMTVTTIRRHVKFAYRNRGVVEVNLYNGDEVRTFRVNTGRAKA